MRWKVESEYSIYRDEWLDLRMADVVLPDGRHLDHRIISCVNGAYVALVQHDQVLLMWRHRFITDAWGWEIPGGGMDPGEEPAAAAAREFEEETGWRPDTALRPLVTLTPSPGLMTAYHHIFQMDSATYIGPPQDGFESERIDWVPLDQVLELINKGDIIDGNTVTAMLYLLSARRAD